MAFVNSNCKFAKLEAKPFVFNCLNFCNFYSVTWIIFYIKGIKKIYEEDKQLEQYPCENNSVKKQK